MPTTKELIATVREGNAHLEAMASTMEFPWSPDATGGDARKLHNVYVRNLIASYVSRFSDLTRGLLSAVEAENYLVYALAGRSLIEITATLRYYITQRYKPLLAKGSLSSEDLQTLIKVDDQHLRGTRFDWESFFFRRYEQLKAEAVRKLKDKKAKVKSLSHDILQDQVNVQTCMEKWAEETPEVIVVYGLFCDLVHPNIGSSFLVASVNNGQLFFSRSKGEPLAIAIFEQSFPMLVSVAHKAFADYLGLLMATIWQEDEFVS